MYLLRDGAGEVTELVCRLVGKAWPAHAAVQIVCAHQQQSQAVDELLWQIPENRFIAHQLHSSQHGSETAPVTIATQTRDALPNSVLVELRESDSVIDSCRQFTRILDIVSNTDNARARARLRYKAYRQLTTELHTHELN